MNRFFHKMKNEVGLFWEKKILGVEVNQSEIRKNYCEALDRLFACFPAQIDVCFAGCFLYPPDNLKQRILERTVLGMKESNICILEEHNALSNYQQPVTLEGYVVFPNNFLEIRKNKEPYRDCTIRKHVMKIVNRDMVLCGVFEDIKKICAPIDDGIVYGLVYSYYRFFKLFLKKFSFGVIILWCQFTPLHRLLKYMAEENGVKIAFMEQGQIPGSVLFDTKGQDLKSLIVKKNDYYDSLSVDDEDFEKANALCEFIKAKSISRKQGSVGFDEVKDVFNDGRPSILFCGQYDVMTGLNKYEKSREDVSPVFASTKEVLLFLQEICARRNWKLIFKPHPFCKQYHDDVISFAQNTGICTISDVNISELIDNSQLLVTISSTCAYDALFRGKPVLLLGYNGLSNKGCGYEAYSRDLVEKEMEAAINIGLTAQMKRNFLNHIAVIRKYFLFDNLEEKDKSLVCDKNLYALKEDIYNYLEE